MVTDRAADSRPAKTEILCVGYCELSVIHSLLGSIAMSVCNMLGERVRVCIPAGDVVFFIFLCASFSVSVSRTRPCAHQANVVSDLGGKKRRALMKKKRRADSKQSRKKNGDYI